MTKTSFVAEQMVRDHERADRVVGGDPAGVADDMGIAFLEAQGPGGVDASVHAGQDRELPARGHRQGRLVEALRVLIVGGQHFLDGGHRSLLAIGNEVTTLYEVKGSVQPEFT